MVVTHPLCFGQGFAGNYCCGGLGFVGLLFCSETRREVHAPSVAGLVVTRRGRGKHAICLSCNLPAESDQFPCRPVTPGSGFSVSWSDVEHFLFRKVMVLPRRWCLPDVLCLL